MTENTYKLIEQFRPQSIDIPIDKCELEKVIETLVSLMFPICNCPDSREVQVELREAAEKLHANIASIHDREAADKKTGSFLSETTVTAATIIQGCSLLPAV